MTVALPLLGGLLSVLLGRWMFGRWFNHVAIYGVMWGASLALFHVGLIYYYPLESETWMVIVAGWLAFIVGSATVVGARFAVQGDSRSAPSLGESPDLGDSLLLKVLWITNAIVVLDAVHELYVLTKLVGSFTNFFSVGRLVYSMRVHGGLPGAIPYLGSLALTACLLAGLYTSLVGRLRLVAVIPILGMIVGSITNMSRAFLIIGGILFVTGYFANPQRVTTTTVKKMGRMRRALVLLIVVAVFVSAMEVVRGNRGMTERFIGASTALEKLGRNAGSFLTPSVILYMSAHAGVLNQYLKKDVEHSPAASLTFAPLWRILSILGFDTYVEQHSTFYRLPVGVNTGSYLKDLHSDYGIVGVVAGPYVLGLLASFFLLRYERSRTLVDLMFLGHVYVAVGMSLFALATQMGNWLASLVFGLFIAFLAGRGNARERQPEDRLIPVG